MVAKPRFVRMPPSRTPQPVAVSKPVLLMVPIAVPPLETVRKSPELRTIPLLVVVPLDGRS
jgi:hypothetical protein